MPRILQKGDSEIWSPNLRKQDQLSTADSRRPAFFVKTGLIHFVVMLFVFDLLRWRRCIALAVRTLQSPPLWGISPCAPWDRGDTKYILFILQCASPRTGRHHYPEKHIHCKWCCRRLSFGLYCHKLFVANFDGGRLVQQGSSVCPLTEASSWPSGRAV